MKARKGQKHLQPTNQPINQPTNQSANQPTNQPINQSTEKPKWSTYFGSQEEKVYLYVYVIVILENQLVLKLTS